MIPQIPANINAVHLTDHFLLREFQCPCCKSVMVHPVMVEFLERLRIKWGKPIIISSGYRCYRHELDVSGEVLSRHGRGLAVDVLITDKAFVDLAYKTYKEVPKWSPLGCFAEKDHVHIQLT